MAQCKSSSLVSATFVPDGPKCPFGNYSVEITIYEGGCVWLKGNSGLGKTTLSTFLAGLSTAKDLAKLDIKCVKKTWNEEICSRERCGVLFQQTTLIDDLTVAGNICLALKACKSWSPGKIKELMENVGLNYARDGNKSPRELSGGMARRASLALQLAQRKRVIILDEPFAGLDQDTALGVVKELVTLRQKCGTAFLLISHESDLALEVMNKRTKHNSTIKLTVPIVRKTNIESTKPNLFGITTMQRFLEKLCDYVFWSLPLILLTFSACGLAIAMLSSDILRRLDVTDQVMEIIDQEIKPLIKMVTGEENNPIALMMVKMKVRSMLNKVIPEAKAKLYAIGMAKLFVLEIGPLLTTLLLCGRIGGSYAGKVATMQSNFENKLLQTLGINPRFWVLLPALMAALIASPFLTLVGTMLAIWLGGIVGPLYGIGAMDSYIREARTCLFPMLRLQRTTFLGFRFIHSDSYQDALIEVLTYPLFYFFIKSVTFMFIVMVVAETVARRPYLTPRGVPGVITFSVVIGSLLIIVADWGFSQLLLLRY